MFPGAAPHVMPHSRLLFTAGDHGCRDLMDRFARCGDGDSRRNHRGDLDRDARGGEGLPSPVNDRRQFLQGCDRLGRDRHGVAPTGFFPFEDSREDF